MDDELIPGLPDEVAGECLARVAYDHFPAVSAVSRCWRRELHSDEFHRHRCLSSLSRSLVALTQAEPPATAGAFKYTATSVYHLALFDPASGFWRRLSPIPELPEGLPLFCQLAGAGRRLVVLGGWNPRSWEVLSGVYIYDFLSGCWRQGASMPGPRRSFFACASDGERRVFVAGGHDEQKTALRSSMVYDVDENRWTQMPDMAHERDECKGSFHAGTFHVIGGYSTESQGGFERTAEGFNIASCQWGPLDQNALAAATCPKACVIACNGSMYQCRAGQLSVKDGPTWRLVSDLPSNVRVGPYLMTWQGDLLVSGSARVGGPHTMYTLVLGKNGKGHSWRAHEVPNEYAGHVQAGCWLEI